MTFIVHGWKFGAPQGPILGLLLFNMSCYYLALHYHYLIYCYLMYSSII